MKMAHIKNKKISLKDLIIPLIIVIFLSNPNTVSAETQDNTIKQRIKTTTHLLYKAFKVMNHAIKITIGIAIPTAEIAMLIARTPSKEVWADYPFMMYGIFIFGMYASPIFIADGIRGLEHEFNAISNTKKVAHLTKKTALKLMNQLEQLLANTTKDYNKIPANLLNSLRSLVSKNTDPKRR